MELKEVTLNQHVKFDGTMYEPDKPCKLPKELVEELKAKGKIQTPQAAATEEGAEPKPAEFSGEQRQKLLRASIITMVMDERGLDRDGKPKVAELEADSGMNTNAEERDALFDAMFPEEEVDGKKTRSYLDRVLGRNKPEKK